MLASSIRAAAVAAASLGAFGTTAQAQSGLDSPAAERARPRLVAESRAIAPGQTILIGITFEIEAGWHTYWHGRNDTVPGPWIEFTAPEGFEVGPVQFPAPRRYVAYERLVDHIYEQQVTLVAPLTAPDAIEQDAVSISAAVNWTVCSDVCLMADATLELSLPVAAPGAAAQPGPEARRFAETRRRLPRPLAPADGIVVKRTEDRIEIRAPGASRLAFYPHEKGPALADLLRDGEARGETLTLRLAEQLGAGRPAEALGGVLEVWRDSARETTLIELRITPEGEAEPVTRQALPPAPQADTDG